MPQPLKNVKVTQCSSTVAAGTSAISSATVIDMQDYESVIFVYSFGTLTSGTVVTAKAAQLATSSPTASTDDIAGSGIAVADTNSDKSVVLEIHKPTYRYIRPCVTRTTQNAVLNSIIAIQFGPKIKPTVQSTTIVAQTSLISPAKGTA